MWREIGNTGLSFLILMFMAQVRKFQDGGKTFTLGGYTFNTDNAEDMKMLEDMASDSTYGGIAQSVLDNVRNGSYANTLKMYRTADGRVVMEGGLQDVADQHLSSGTQKALQRKDTYINNLFKRQSAKDWANNTDAFLSEITRRKNSKEDVSGSDNKKRITGVSDIASGQWVYTPDNKWSIDSPDNARMLEQLRYLEEYYNASENDRKKYYDVSALDPDELKGWLTWRKTNAAFNPDLFKENALRISDNDPFYSQYRWFGFTPGTKSQIEARTAETASKNLKETLAKEGLNWNGIENDWTIDANGNLIATQDLLQKMGLSGSVGYWFNDDWNKVYTDSGATNPYAQLLGSAIINGKLYKNVENNTALHNWLKNTQYDEEMDAWNAEKANKILRTYWTTENPFFTLIDDSQLYNPWTWRQNRNMRAIQTKIPRKGYSLIEYYSPIENDPLFRKELKYLWLDDNTGETIDLSLDDVNKLALLDEYGNFKEVEKGKKTYAKLLNENGVYETAHFNNTGGIRVFHKPDINTYYINKDGSEYIYKLPGFGEFLNQNPLIHWYWLKDVWNYVNGESNYNLDLIPSTWKDATTILEQVKAHPQDHKAPLNYVTRNSSVQSNKNGGVLKFTNGGRYKSIDEFYVPEYKPFVTTQNTSKKSNKKWTNADWWDFGAACADGLSAILTLIDPTNISGAISGLGGTVAGFTADVKRDGFDLGDLGRGLLNLGGDVITLIPGVGDIVAIPKIAKKFKTIAWLLRKGIQAGAITGVGQALIVGIDRIAKGETLSASDYRAIANGLQGLSTITKLGAKAVPTKKVTKNLPEFKNSKGEVITLSAEATKNIKTANPSDQLLQTQIELTTAYRKKNPNTTLSDDEILDQFVIPTKNKYAIWKKNRGAVPTNLEPVTSYRPLNTSEYYDFNANHGKLWQWWNSTGNMQRAITPQPQYSYNPHWLKQQLPNGIVPGTEIELPLPNFTGTYKGNGYVISGQNAFSGGSPLITPVPESEPEEFQYLSPEEFFGYYKKGGILKGQWGLNSSQTFKPKVGDWKPLSKPSILDPNYSITTSATQRAWNNAITGTFSNTPTIIDAFGNELQLDANRGFVRSHSATTGTTGVTGTGGEVTDPLSARVDSPTNEYLRKAEQSRNRNRLTQLFAAELQRRMGNQFADKTRNNLLMNRAVSPNLSWNQRWIDPRGNQAERLGASLLTSTNQFNTADSGLNRAAKLDMLGKIGQLGMNNIDQQANAFNTQLDATNQRNMQQRIMDAQTRTQNNQIMSNAYAASDQQRYGANNAWLTTTANIFDKIEAENTTKWNKLGQTKANLEMQAAKYDELAASAKDDATRTAYQAMASKIRDPKTLELYLNSGGYSTQSAKKGAKLRPIHEQMLIDKQKLVARAIEKINENTMKILLKAMS